MPDLTNTLIASILGLGWLSTAVGWLKDRNSQKQKIREYLIERRQKLNEDPELLMTIGYLEAEQRANRERREAPSYPDGFDGSDLRRLPGFLEGIGVLLMNSPIRPKDAYEQFGREVVLCHRSIVLWIDEQEPYSDIWWGSFKKFAEETEKHSKELYADIEEIVAGKLPEKIKPEPIQRRKKTSR